MAKITAIFAAVLILGSCVPQIPSRRLLPRRAARGRLRPRARAAPPAPSGQAAFGSAARRRPLPAVRDSLLFLGRSIDEVFVAAKIGLADCRYAIKSSDKGSRLIVASRTGADPALYSRWPTVQVFTDPSGAPGVKVLIAGPGPAGSPSGEIPGGDGKNPGGHLESPEMSGAAVPARPEEQ